MINQNKHKRIAYRPEIDGLRALAVLSVAIFHGHFTRSGEGVILGGGYLGVDIFFVISGFLITSIIYKDLVQGKFSFREFYVRRTRRILPVLLSVVLVTIPFAYYFFLPSELESYAKSGLSMLGFASNIWFGLEDTYFAPNNEAKLLLHTWSLSVEEQFYIIFPLLGWLLFKTGKRNLLYGLSGLLLLSLLFCVFYDDQGLETKFYLFPFRAWELLAGSVLAIWIQRNENHLLVTSRRRVFTANLMALCGLLSCIGSFMFFTKETQHPGILTAIPILGTVVLLHPMTARTVVGKVLAWKPFVWIGLVSYSFYLWHWVILASFEFVSFRTSEFERGLALVVALLVSVASYFFIERPFRFKLSRPKFFMSQLAMIFLVASLFGTIVFFKGVVPIRGTDPIIIDTLEEGDEVYQSSYDPCYFRERNFLSNFPFDHCVNVGETGKNVLVFGDSHTRAGILGLEHAYRDAPVNLSMMGTASCRPLSVRTSKAFSLSSQCIEMLAYIFRSEFFIQFEEVFLFGGWSDPSAVPDLQETVNYIRSQGLKVTVIGSPLHFVDALPYLYHWFPNINDSWKRKYVNTGGFEIDQALKRMFESIDSREVAFYSMLDERCPEQTAESCEIIFQDRWLVSYDKGHALPSYAREFFQTVVKLP